MKKNYLNSLAYFVLAASCLFGSASKAAQTKVEQNLKTENPEILEYKITAQKLEKSRNSLSPKSGGSSYSFTRKDIENLPQGQITSLNQVLLRAPGVAQNSNGDFHIRGDHSNVQYRINGVMIPESITGFAKSLDTHFAENVELLTGSLPAQYGYRTAGVIDIKTKSGAFTNENRSELTVGSNDTFIANQQLGGSKGKLNYYLNASYQQNDMGIESPTNGRKSIHNQTKQDRLFGYFSYLLDSSTKLSAILSSNKNRYQIPNQANQETAYQLNGVNSFSSSNLREKQYDSTDYAILALQGISENDVNYQLSVFGRQSDLVFKGDYAGDLMFNGVASNIDQKSFASGTQGDFSYDLDENNTTRFGFFASNDSVKNYRDSYVFSVDSNGDQNSLDPILINDGSKKDVRLYGLYLQNEWKAIDKLSINYGLRFDKIDSYIQDHQTSPRVGAVYELSNATKLHAGYARYFSPPTSELLSSSTISKFDNTTNQAENSVNGKVKAETSDYYDVGIAHKVNQNLNLGFDTYYKKVRNMLDRDQFGAALIYTPFNYDRAVMYGAEFTADYKKDNFSAYLNFAAQRAKARGISSAQYLFSEDELSYINGRYVNPDHSQRYSASTGVSYLFNQTKYILDAIYGNGLRTGDYNSNKMRAYWQFNSAISRDVTLPIIEKINARLSIVNLFDRSYAIKSGEGIGVGAPRFGPRRTFYLTLAKSF